VTDETPPRRKTLSLKPGTPLPAALQRIPVAPPPPPPPPPAPAWRCRPCGAAFDVPAETPDDERVRCPSCNAKVGLAADFRSDPPLLEKLRARPAPPPKPTEPEPPRRGGFRPR
jgi:hypothetical protein